MVGSGSYSVYVGIVGSWLCVSASTDVDTDTDTDTDALG